MIVERRVRNVGDAPAFEGGWPAVSRRVCLIQDSHEPESLPIPLHWVAANPDNSWFSSMKMPPPSPIMTIIDGGSQMARRANSTKDRKPINRLRATDINIEPLPKDADHGGQLAV